MEFLRLPITWSLITHHLSHITYHTSLITHHLSHITYHLLPITNYRFLYHRGPLLQNY